jgi:excisionase family DNA binding protein
MSDDSQPLESWLTISEAARRLNVHASTLRRWADEGEIPYMATPGGHRRFSSGDIVAFAEQRRLQRRSGDMERTWANTALSVTRESLAVQRDERWLERNGGWRERHRELGQRLMGLTMQFVAAQDGDDQAPFLDEAHKIGCEYAHIAREAELPLSEVLRASLFFRDMLIETALQLPAHMRIQPEANLRLLRRINRLLNTVHLTIAEEYDAFNSDQLPGN